MPALTVTRIDSIKPAKERREVRDDGCDNLYLVIQPSGAKSWAWRGRLNGKTVKRTLGRYPLHGLADARDWANRISQGRDLGVDIIVETAKAEEEKDEAAKRTAQWAFDLYMEAEGNDRRTAGEKRRAWNVDIAPQIGDKILADLTHDDLADIIDAKAASARIAANRLVALIKRWTRWCVTKGRRKTGLRIDPAIDLYKPHGERKRQRYLNDYELSVLIAALETYEMTFADPLLLLLYTGTRFSEVTEADWNEFNFSEKVWLIPGTRTKNKLEHLVHLTDPILKILNRIPRRNHTSLLFPSRAFKPGVVDAVARPISGYHRAKDNLVAIVSAIAKLDGNKIEPWRFHDFRRSISTKLSSMSDENYNGLVQPHIVEALLNHISSAKDGVAGVYNCYSYAKEKRHALMLWNDHLESLRGKINIDAEKREQIAKIRNVTGKTKSAVIKPKRSRRDN